MSDLERLIEAAKKINRGCDCEYDYRCLSCEHVIALHAVLKEIQT